MMASRGEDVWVVVYAWNTSTQAYEPDDVANVTLRLLLDGVDTAPANAPFAWNVTGCPGRIVLKLDAAQTAGKRSITVGGKSSTSGVIILDSPVTFEQLPTAAPGATNGLPQVGVAPLTLLDVAVGSRLATSAYTLPLDAAGARAALGLASANLDTQLSARTGFKLASDGLDLVVIEAGLNARQALSVVTASAAGVLSGAGTSTVVIKGGGVATTRITAGVDGQGNRTSAGLNPPP
jgi:hypothetical protein